MLFSLTFVFCVKCREVYLIIHIQHDTNINIRYYAEVSRSFLIYQQSEIGRQQFTTRQQQNIAEPNLVSAM